VTWRDVADWMRLTGNVLEPWEARAIVTLGLVRANIVSEKMAAEHKAMPSAATGRSKK
jgi:hypothetical protein